MHEWKSPALISPPSPFPLHSHFTKKMEKKNQLYHRLNKEKKGPMQRKSSGGLFQNMEKQEVTKKKNGYLAEKES